MSATGGQDVIPLFRAVGDTELASLYTCQCFSLGPNGFPKQFFHTLGEAVAFGNQFIVAVMGRPHYHVVRTNISRRLYLTLDLSASEPGIGPIVTVPNGLLPAFNADMKRHGNWQYLGTY